jgi:nitroreductase
MNLNDFEQLVQTRRAIRDFKPDPIEPELLERLIRISQWAPSGYNLQPTHFVIVDDQRLKEQLHKVCMFQRQVLEAPATVVFTGDRNVYQNNLEHVINMDIEVGAINQKYEQKMREFISLSFSQDPMGLGWLWKAVLPPFVRYFKPVPSIPAVQKSYWLAKQVMLNAMVFMLAAHSAGLATVPMEGFDEYRVRSILNIPNHHTVPLVIPVGYMVEKELKKSRLPLDKVIHKNGWNQ